MWSFRVSSCHPPGQWKEPRGPGLEVLRFSQWDRWAVACVSISMPSKIESAFHNQQLWVIIKEKEWTVNWLCSHHLYRSYHVPIVCSQLLKGKDRGKAVALHITQAKQQGVEMHWWEVIIKNIYSTTHLPLISVPHFSPYFSSVRLVTTIGEGRVVENN